MRGFSGQPDWMTDSTGMVPAVHHILTYTHDLHTKKLYPVTATHF